LERRVEGRGDARLSVEDLSRLSVDDLFMEEYGLCCTRRLPLGLAAKPPAFSIWRAAAAGLGAAAAA
jgi:hypothetical protein